jgi:hypothetical protein
LYDLADDLRKFSPFRRGDPGELDPAFFKPEVFEEPFQGCRLSSPHIVPGEIMAVSRMTPRDQHSIDPALKGLENKERVDSTGAGDPDDADVRRILDPRCSGKVRPGIRTPVTEEC